MATSSTSDLRTYHVTGMTCSSCAATVQGKLAAHADVEQAVVQHPSGTARLQLRMPVPFAVLGRLLDGTKYALEQQAPPMDTVLVVEARSFMVIYKPLLILVAFLVGIAALSAWRDGVFHGMLAMRYFMAGFFLAFSFFKFLDLAGFAESYSTYDLLAKRWQGYGFVYPFIELALGVAYLIDLRPVFTNVATMAVMGFSLIGVLVAVLNKQRIQCACLGTVFNLPMSTVTIVEDAVMIAMAAAMLVVA